MKGKDGNAFDEGMEVDFETLMAVTRIPILSRLGVSTSAWHHCVYLYVMYLCICSLSHPPKPLPQAESQGAPPPATETDAAAAGGEFFAKPGAKPMAKPAAVAAAPVASQVCVCVCVCVFVCVHRVCFGSYQCLIWSGWWLLLGIGTRLVPVGTASCTHRSHMGFFSLRLNDSPDPTSFLHFFLSQAAAAVPAAAATAQATPAMTAARAAAAGGKVPAPGSTNLAAGGSEAELRAMVSKMFKEWIAICTGKASKEEGGMQTLQQQVHPVPGSPMARSLVS